MDEILISRWNEVVKPTDHIWHLGDLAMGKKKDEADALIAILKRLNGHKRLILGNHDHFHPSVYQACRFDKVQSSHRFEGVLFSHIPVHPLSMGRALANVHGHIHDHPDYPPIQRAAFINNWGTKPTVSAGFSPFINICVEHTDYRPISWEEVQTRIKRAS